MLAYFLVCFIEKNSMHDNSKLRIKELGIMFPLKSYAVSTTAGSP